MPQCYLINHPLLLKLILVQINMPRSEVCVISIQFLCLKKNINTVVVPEAIKHLINSFAFMRIIGIEDSVSYYKFSHFSRIVSLFFYLAVVTLSISSTCCCLLFEACMVLGAIRLWWEIFVIKTVQFLALWPDFLWVEKKKFKLKSYFLDGRIKNQRKNLGIKTNTN